MTPQSVISTHPVLHLLQYKAVFRVFSCLSVSLEDGWPHAQNCSKNDYPELSALFSDQCEDTAPC